MKKLKTGLVALLISLGGMTWAQNLTPAPSETHTPNGRSDKSPEERATSRSQMLTKRLGLNTDQQKQVYNICLQHAQQNMAAKSSAQGDREAMRNARKQNEEAFDKNLSAVLTADQKTKYEQLKQEQMQRQEEKHEKGGIMK